MSKKYLSKEAFTSFIERYHLNGLVNDTEIKIEGGTGYTLFKNDSGSVRGEIIAENLNYPDGLIYVYYTDKLLKLSSILEEDITVEYLGNDPTDNSVVQLQFKDAKGKKITYACSNSTIIDSDNKKSLVKDHEVTIKLNAETIQDILKSFTAISIPLDTQQIAFEKRDNKLIAIFGYSTSNSNTIELELDTDELSDDYDEIVIFPAAGIKEILSINGKRFSEATLEISVKGLLQFKFKDNNLNSTYWIRKSN